MFGVSGEGELSVVVVALEGDSGGGFESPAVWASGGGAVVFEVAKGESQSLVVDAQYFSQGDSRGVFFFEAVFAEADFVFFLAGTILPPCNGNSLLFCEIISFH